MSFGYMYDPVDGIGRKLGTDSSKDNVNKKGNDNNITSTQEANQINMCVMWFQDFHVRPFCV